MSQEHERSIILIAHNLRSCHNVGSLLRTAEGLGADTMYLTGYTPYPIHPASTVNKNDPVRPDSRLPHEAVKIHKQIIKTSLGAENLVRWHHSEDIFPVLKQLQDADYALYAVEQTRDSIKLPDFNPPAKVALIVGREVEGIESAVLLKMDGVLEIPMFGEKESFNVVQAAAMALYQCRFAG